MNMKSILCLLLAVMLALGTCALAEGDDLQAQLDEANARIEELEAQVEKYRPFYDFLKKHSKDDAKGAAQDAAFAIIKHFLTTHLYGIALSVTIVTAAALSIGAATPYIEKVEAPKVSVNAPQANSDPRLYPLSMAPTISRLLPSLRAPIPSLWRIIWSRCGRSSNTNTSPRCSSAAAFRKRKRMRCGRISVSKTTRVAICLGGS